MLEARQVALPVSARAAAVFMEVSGDAVERFDRRTPESIAAAMLRAVAEPAWPEELVGRRVKDYTRDRTARGTLYIFKEVLAAR